MKYVTGLNERHIKGAIMKYAIVTILLLLSQISFSQDIILIASSDSVEVAVTEAGVSDTLFVSDSNNLLDWAEREEFVSPSNYFIYVYKGGRNFVRIRIRDKEIVVEVDY